MGCGFSTEDSKASDEERILNAANNSSMGQKISKKKSPSKKGNRDSNGISSVTTSSAASPDDRFNKSSVGSPPPGAASNNGKLANNGKKTSPLNIQSTTNELSTSQVNFFKMLDEKIENGFELEEHEDEEDSEQERQLRLQRVAEEWDNLLGRSQDSNDLHSKDNLVVVKPKETTVESSTDSMRTMFSNSVTLPAGTLREATAATTTASQSKKDG